MRKLYFLLPGTGSRFACGGLWAELKTFELARQICPAEVVTYRQREANTLFLDDVLQTQSLDDVIFVISWGFDVPKLAARLARHCVVYHAHSAEYGFKLPSRVPIITVSRSTMGYWGQRSPHSLIYYLPNHISENFRNLHQPRDIDVVVQARKSSSYLLKELIPALKQHSQVYVVESFIDDLAGLFNRTRVYLYDSSEYWALQGVTEGFGLQPLEAIACGCRVFSSVNHGLSDYLDPGFNGEKIAGYSKEYDVQRILKALQSPQPVEPDEWLKEYRAANITQRLTVILGAINEFFDYRSQGLAPIQDLTSTRLLKLQVEQWINKVQRKLKSRR
ncbi:glycosyltransferase [Oscillatoria sp. FACHB-1407]|uniref:glycosyltransferase n=1 Tax=Oscillatoria sp. FACHB-1407 TaxID=2692847 RepID=UPI001685FDDC|nr:glycosyltransferase [Oscillatoria sp. FACHB-1407]MBD2459427.1 glycosyltransferase [Oscillatoria sp. FACHB-1407]